ncbi:chaperone TorD involved in molybdoenzyme TorA maturation [Noviherbaspirillum humi]|uniref:Chaperone TorD involved in molybdoenzyme TorA maturation n=1 Tax=Noviherbaspirillum humi TaxID=1688639 RepID=A0A239M575_9BURK|nr:molecular chaperone TorD family protein [Noviherbaspirillum humi]SNT37845.1 chaperone TorD involved in molybdoenzyme TorA maturation [Noviherbaspirillum humi]
MDPLGSPRITELSFVPSLPQEDQARADFYALSARLLLAPPDAALLQALAGADSLDAQADNPLDSAWEQLIAAAAAMDPEAAKEEFDSLFISIGNPKINPYGSFYIAGFLNEKPLAKLRGELADLGLARSADAGEMEDHLAALCEAMRLMIAGEQAGMPGATRQSLARQKAFFDVHLKPWYRRCLDDIRLATEANFYRRVADFVQAFLDIEAEAFEMEENACIN